MQKVSLRKLSLLGLVLMGASAVTAAVLPAVKEDEDALVLGSLTVSTVASGGPKLTCTVPTVGDDKITQPCNISASGTTGVGAGSSDENESDSTVDDVIVP